MPAWNVRQAISLTKLLKVPLADDLYSALSAGEIVHKGSTFIILDFVWI